MVAIQTQCGGFMFAVEVHAYLRDKIFTHTTARWGILLVILRVLMVDLSVDYFVNTPTILLQLAIYFR